MSTNVSNLLYLITIVTFILALRFLSNPATARRGNLIGAVGMLVAIVVTFAQKGVDELLGDHRRDGRRRRFGAVAARKVRMTAMPQMVALFNGVGGGAAALIALAEFHNHAPDPGALKADIAHPIMLSAIIGSISFAGSMVAFAKLQELIRGRPITFPRQQVANGLLFAAIAAAGIAIARGQRAAVADLGARRRRVALRDPVRPADRRRGHAGRDLAAERVHRSRGGRDGLRAREQRADRERHARRRFGNAADDHDGPGDEPLGRERPLRRVRAGRAGGGRRSLRRDGRTGAFARPRRTSP